MRKTNSKEKKEVECQHSHVKSKEGYIVCEDCGLILSEEADFNEIHYPIDFYKDSQIEYEKEIQRKDFRAIQDPKIKEKFERLKSLDTWYRDPRTVFMEQKKTLELLKNYFPDLKIDSTKFQEIKKRYQKYYRKHKKTYQNMVIIFLAIVWMEIKDTTRIRLEHFIKACNELGHKINKRMLSKAMTRIRKTEQNWSKKKQKQIKKQAPKIRDTLEHEIKNKIKLLFQQNLNNILFSDVKHVINDEQEHEKLKMKMLLAVNRILNVIPYETIKNLNYKAFTAGLLYYVGKIFKRGKINPFTQYLIQKVTKFSSTTIRKKYHFLVNLLGEPEKFIR
ncbi:MAG: hypothetical protein ACTSYC_09640 [Promethearchaeota archaeon]